MRTENPTPRIPIWFRDAWCAALRSGLIEQYQGGGMCTTDGEMCCLGVGMFVDPEAPSPTPRPDKSGTLTDNLFQFDGASGTPEEKERERWGLIPSTIGVLIAMNDRHMKTFTQIADWIEANYPVDETVTEPPPGFIAPYGFDPAKLPGNRGTAAGSD